MPQITSALRRVRGVERVAVDEEALEVVVTRRAGDARDDVLLAALQACGYPGQLLPVEETRLRVCGAETRDQQLRVAGVLHRLRGVRQVGVVRATGCMVVTYDRRHVQCASLLRALRRAGFAAEVVSA